MIVVEGAELLAGRAADAIPDDLVEAFAGDGAVCVRGLFSGAEIALLEQGIEENLTRPSANALIASRADDPGRFFEDFCNWQRIAAYRRFLGASPVAAAAARLMGAGQVRFYHDHLLVKESNTRQKTPWHQDQPYYNVDGLMNCSLWLPVDPVPRESSLEFIAGSHRQGWLMPRSFRDNQAKWFPEGTLKELPDIEADRAAFPILGWALEPGDAVFFHMLALHGAAGSTGRRRVMSLRFLGEDMRHAVRPWKTSPDFPGLADELPDGAVLDHPLFPVIWETAA